MSTKPFLLAAAAVLIAAPLAAQPAPHWVPGHWDWSGGRDTDAAAYALHGPGVKILFPELRETRRGRAFVARNFSSRGNGWIGFADANSANHAFEAAVGPNHARFDWTLADRAAPAGWDRQAMRAYGFRDTPQGTRLTLSDDVLFATDSAVLRPGAIEKLRALAAYLQGNPAVRIAIDGYTDSRGSDAHNIDLSQRRAESVRAAFDSMNVTAARFRVRGHGKADPVAPNTSAAGMRQNRRVEITLLGQRSATFR